MLRAWLATVVLTILPPAACATTKWLCSLAEGLTRIVCVADDDDLRDTAASDPAATTAVVRGTRFPLDPRRTWSVEMWSPATEDERVSFLARATICYRSPNCEVVMAETYAIAQRWAPHRR